MFLRPKLLRHCGVYSGILTEFATKINVVCTQERHIEIGSVVTQPRVYPGTLRGGAGHLPPLPRRHRRRRRLRGKLWLGCVEVHCVGSVGHGFTKELTQLWAYNHI